MTSVAGGRLVAHHVLPAGFVVGLVLIPIGWYFHTRRTDVRFRDLVGRQFREEDLAARQAGSRVFRMLVLLTSANLILMLLVGGATVRFMDSAHFYGTACPCRLADADAGG